MAIDYQSRDFGETGEDRKQAVVWVEWSHGEGREWSNEEEG